MEEQTQIQQPPSPEELKKIILSLVKQGYSKSQIGQILKEKYSVYDVRTIFGKKLSKLLEEWGVKEDIPEDLIYLFRKVHKLLKHLEKHKKDVTAARSLMYTEAKIRKLVRYYIKKGKLSSNFKYTRSLVKMYGTA